MAKSDVPAIPQRIQPARKCKRLPDISIPEATSRRATRRLRPPIRSDTKQTPGAEPAKTPSATTQKQVRMRAPAIKSLSDQSTTTKLPARKSYRTSARPRPPTKLKPTERDVEQKTIRSRPKRSTDAVSDGPQASSSTKRRRTPPPSDVPSSLDQAETAKATAPKVKAFPDDLKPVRESASPVNDSERTSKGLSIPRSSPLDIIKSAEATEPAPDAPQSWRLTEREQRYLPGFVPEVLPDGHKLIHLMRHCASWHK
jgi:hypothetical protein